MKRCLIFILVVSFSMTLLARSTLTFEERVKAQEAIERVYYSHRIWPKENPQPKPPFEKMVPKEVIEAKVTDYLKKCAALDQFWQRPIIASQLQAEMDRMAKGTKDPATLNELFAALDNDPYLIAECLARPVLADRLIHNWYANDERFHGEIKAKAEEAVKQLTHENFASLDVGEYSTVTYKLETESEETFAENPEEESNVIRLPQDEWEETLSKYPQQGGISSVIESDQAFTITHAVRLCTDEMVVETRSFPKKSFSEWWNIETMSVEPMKSASESASYAFSGPQPEVACESEWINSSLNTIFDQRMGHVAVWTGSEMIVWGGYFPVSDTHTNTGYVYSPATDTETSTSTGGNCPSARGDHSGLWTGSEMIVWGGWSRTSPYTFNTGGRYYPLTDTWTVTSIGTGCPSKRYCHTAVWTGSEMIIWGGMLYSGLYTYYNNGAKYSPSSGTWTAISAPISGRALHTAVWTGSEMIVWGGKFSNNSPYFTNTGARYNPSTSIWTETSTGTDCPTMRNRHTAIWTGTEMIVWGGATDQYGDIFFNTGGRYNPLTDSWIATPTGSSCPSARSQHTAIWTGSEMIVWGSPHSTDNTGGRFFPSTNTWKSTSTGTYCPSARRNCEAVWTGGEMIIWGGGEWLETVTTGGIYCPSPQVFGLFIVCGANEAALSTANYYSGYQWFKDSAPITDATANTYNATESGDYFVRVTRQDGCTMDSEVHTVTFYALPTPTVTGDVSGCSYPGLTLSTEEYSSYQWIKDGIDISGATSQTYTVTESGSYAIRVVDGYGCTGTSSVQAVNILQSPLPSISGLESGCGSVHLSTEAYTSYQWTLDGSAISGATSQEYDATQNGTYTVLVTDSSGCQGMSTGKSVTIYSFPTPSITGNTAGCSTSGLTLSTGSFSTYQWNYEGEAIVGAKSQSYQAFDSGNYSVTVSNEGDCSGTSSTHNVTVYSTPPVVSGASSTCTGSVVTLSTITYPSYQWYRDGVQIDGATGQMLDVTGSGTYAVFVDVPEGGCSGTSEGHVVQFADPPASPPVITGASANTCPATSVTLQTTEAFGTYQWYHNGTPIPGATGQTFSATLSGDYSVSAGAVPGCRLSSATHSVSISFCPPSEVSPKMAVYPAAMKKDAGSSTGYYLYFQKIDGVTGYNIYEGTMGSWYSHSGQPGNVCAATVTDLGTGEMRAEISPSEGNHYYLVTAYAGSYEGPSGFNSANIEIDPLLSSCGP